MTGTTLYRHQCKAVALTDCLSRSFSKHRLVGYCQTPRRLLFGTWDGAVYLDANDTETDLTQVYEARLFSEAGELRWLRDPESDGLGRAAWLSETDDCPEEFSALDALTELGIIDQFQLGSSVVPNRVLTQSRAHLPGVPSGQRGVYRIREYIGAAPGEAGTQGNRIIVEQRSLGIEAWTEGDAS